MDKKKIRKLVFGGLNKIYNTSITLSKTYLYELIPLTVLREVINRAYLKIDAEIPIEFINNYNEMLNVLYETCAEDATKSGLVLPVILRHHIAVTKNAFTSGLG